jgi:ATP synthase protein I
MAGRLPVYTLRVTASNDPRTIRVLGQLSTIGLSFVLALVMGFAAGNWLDRRLDTRPWLSLLGFAAGLAAGVLNVVRTMKSVSTSGPPPPPSAPGAAPPP